MKLDKEPLVSVIIPVFNSEKWILETIESVWGQTYSNLEIIIIDDGSIDNTANIINGIQNNNINLYYYFQNNSGPAAARNLGINKSNGEYIAFLDSDDVWLSDKLTKQLEFMQLNDCSLSIGNMSVVDENLNNLYNQNKKLPKSKEEIIRALFENKITMNTPTIVVQKSILLDNNIFFDEELRNREDHFFLMNFANKAKICLIQEHLALRRVRNDSLSQMDLAEDIINKNLLFVEKANDKFPYLDINSEMARLFLGQATFYIKKKKNNILKIFQLIFKSIRLKPFSLKPYAVIIVVLFKLDIENINKFLHKFTK